TETPPPVQALNPAVPGAFARIVEWLMAKRPEDRPESTEAVRGLLLPWAGESVTRAAPGPHSEREAVEEIDTRAFDPGLWDVTPYPADPAAGAGPPAVADLPDPRS